MKREDGGRKEKREKERVTNQEGTLRFHDTVM